MEGLKEYEEKATEVTAKLFGTSDKKTLSKEEFLSATLA